MKRAKVKQTSPGLEAIKERIAYLKGHRDEIMGRLAAVTTRCGMMYISRRLERFDLGTGQAFILAELLYKDGLSQDDVRGIMKMDKGTVTRALQYLEKRGYIRREQDKEDRRVIRVYVTQKARTIEIDFFSILLEWNQAITQGLTQEELRQLISLMNRVAENAETMARSDAE